MTVNKYNSLNIKRIHCKYSVLCCPNFQQTFCHITQQLQGFFFSIFHDFLLILSTQNKARPSMRSHDELVQKRFKIQVQELAQCWCERPHREFSNRHRS